MLGIQQRSHNHVQAHGFTLFGGTRHQKVRGVGQVEHFHLLGNGVTDGDRQFCLAVTEGRIVQKSLERHDGRFVIGHLNAHGVRQGGDTYALGIERDADIFLELLDGGNFNTGGRIYLIQCNGGTYHGRYIAHLDFVAGQGCADLVVVAAELILRHLMAGAGIVPQNVQRRRFVLGQAIRRIQAVVDGL